MSNKIIEEMLDEVFEGCVADKLRIGQDAGGGEMIETKRTAQQIRAYLKAFEYGRIIAKTPAKRRAYYTEVGPNARTDLPAVLDAAVKEREDIGHLLVLLPSELWTPEVSAIYRRRLKNDWLAESSPEAAQSPDGENEEESET